MKKITNLRWLIMSLLLAVGAGSAWGDTATLPNTQALTTSFANVGNDTHIQIKTSSANTYTNPLRFYANTTITIQAASGYVIQSVTYEASSTGNYVTYAQNADVSPNVTPTVSDKNVTWTLNDVSVFTFTPSAQTRANSITITYQATTVTPDLDYDIDFESNLTSYTTWKFTNIGTSNSTITAHGGSKYGATINSSGNGTQSSSIETKEKIANPETFTCYISKTTTNTSASSWYVQVSSDGSAWQTVETYDAKNMNKGTWKEFSVNLSNYQNVFVRLYYYGSTAIRAVDDISLTESTTITPSISFEESEVQLTVGDTFTNTLNTSHIGENTISYMSSNATAVSVDSNGLVTANETGTAMITASVTVDGTTYTDSYTVTVVEAVVGETATFTKITSSAALTTGEYLIVYEDGNVIFDGSLSTLDAANNNQSVEISNNKIETNPIYGFTINTSSGTIRSYSGYYIGRNSDSNGMDASANTAHNNTISFDDNGNAVIMGNGGAYLRYNSASNQLRFRYYKSDSYTNQKVIQLYKKDGLAAPIITPVTGEYTEKPQTITIEAEEGATIYYTTDGSTPTTSSNAYSAPFTTTKSVIVKAIAVKDGQTSSVVSESIRFYVAPPTFTPDDGSVFTNGYNVSISAPESGSTIYYVTQDNKIFKSASGKAATWEESTGELLSTAQVYSSPLTFNQSMMVTAICKDADGSFSAPVVVQYTYTGAVQTPYYSSFAASAGDFTKTQDTDDNTMSNHAPEWTLGSNTGSTAIVNWGEERYYMTVKGTSGNTTQDRTRYYGKAYLTSPIIDLTGKTDATLSFIHAGHHFYIDPNETPTKTAATVKSTEYEKQLDNRTTTDGAIRSACKVEVGECDASGNVSTWVDISDQVAWFSQKFNAKNIGADNLNSEQTQIKPESSINKRSGMFPRKNSGNISLATYAGKNIRIRFVYTSTPQSYGTWNVDQILVSATSKEKMSMNDMGWTTYVFDHDVDAYATTQKFVEQGKTLKIFKVTEFDHETCVLQQLGLVETHNAENDDSERYIPAKTPVVINGPSGEIDFNIHNSDEMLPTVKNNLLIASLSPNLAVAPAGSGIRYFVLQWNNSTNAPWFNKVREGREIPDHRAYLNGTDQCAAITTSSNPVKGIYVLGEEEEEATGIVNVENVVNTKDNQFYNLAGQRVMNPTKGIYIVNGKKVFIK